MYIRLKAFFIIICCLGQIMHIYAQSNPYNAVSIASPTAGSLGKFVDIPVGYHTGLPTINIPIYTVETGPLKLPVSLSYHASGLRVMEPAGWVGAGWALDAGGVITRTVKGAPDESYTSNTSDQSKGHFSNYGYNSYLYNGNMQDWMSFAQGGKDGEPDLFFFNFGGYTGTFFFSDDRKPVLLPEQDLKITCVYTGTGSIASFVITTPEGIKYSFGRTGSSTSPDPIEITNPFSPTNSNVGTSISSWYLNRIESSDGVFSISLRYTAESYSYYTIASASILSTETTNTTDCYLVKNFIQGVRLSQISFPNGTIDFLPGSVRTDLGAADIRDFTDYVNTNAASLAAIQISSKYLCKKFNLYTSYFQDNTSVLPAPIASQSSIGTDKKRLRLDSIKEMSCTGSLALPAYKFDYNTELVPRRLTFAQDHWGYYNGATGNAKLIPTYFLDGDNQTTVAGANREAKWPEMRGGSLKRITYPTGGYTDFELEPHRSNVSYDNYTYITSASLSIGYDGSNPITRSIPVTLTVGDYYLLSVGTTNLGSNASLYLTNVGSTTQIASVTATTAAISNNLKVYIPAGNYTLNIYKDCTNPTGQFTGTGANGDISRVVNVGVTADTIIGGLRVKTITQHDNTGNPDITTSYNYKEDNGISSGQLYSRPVYVQQVRNDLIQQIGFWNPSTGFTQSCSPLGCISCAGIFYYKSGNSIQPLETTQGNHIGYSTVKVSKTGNGSSTYRYETGLSLGASSHDVAVRRVNTATCLSITPNYPPAPVPFNFQRGNLKEEQHFSEAGKILRNIDYYSSYSGPRDSTPAFIVANFGSTYLGTYYTIATARKLSETMVKTDYNHDNNQSISSTTTVYFESQYHHQLTKQAVVNSKGDSLINKYRYAFDFAAPSCQNPGNCKVVYYGNCQTCQTQYNASQSSCAGNSLCISNAYLAYQQCLSQARVSYSGCRRTNFTDSLSVYNTCFKTALNNAGTDLKPLYGLQNEYRNPLIETSAWNDNTLLESVFNSYSFATDPANKVYPSKTQQINLTAPSATFTAATVNGTALTKDGRYEDETQAVFSAGSIVQFTDKKGVPMAYVWDVNHLQPIAVIRNAASSQVAYTSFETDGSGTWTVPSALRDTTQGITGKNAYVLSNGAITKASLATTQSYIVSYWSKSGSATVNGATVASALTKRGWNYYEHKIAAGVSTISVSGSITIDELRLYPSNAQMMSCTYIPVLGLNSQCDAVNHVTYYEYDPLGRLQVLRDMDNNIVKTYEYHYKN